MRVALRTIPVGSGLFLLLAACEPAATGPTTDAATPALGAPDAPSGADVSTLLDAGPSADAPAADAPSSGRLCSAFCATGAAATGARTTPRLETLVADVAAATCAAAFRCCDAADRELVVAPIRGDGADEWPLASLRPRLPPDDADFTETECREVLAEAFAIRPFGSWVSEVAAGRVRFDLEAYASCLEALETASCGQEMAQALGDGTCLAFLSPAGGEAQRSMFRREAGPGAPCRRIEDGIGAGLYGTCDPARAYCCFDRPDVGSDCWLPNTADAVGTCREVAATGDRCGFSPSGYRLCATGSDCGGGGTCEAPASALPTAAEGETCFRDLMFVAECGPDGTCDVLGTETCVRLRADGEACEEPSVCRSGVCR